MPEMIALKRKIRHFGGLNLILKIIKPYPPVGGS